MNDDWKQAIQALLQSTQIAFLSTMGKKSPETSMCPYAVLNSDIVLHLSGLAQHSKNIQTHQQVGLMICTPETKASSPLALPRISFTGTIKQVEESEQEPCQEAYLNHIPDAQPLFAFPDFKIYRIQVAEIKWVGGFGKARKIPLETWKSLC